jgi:hypothetical protein
LHSHARRRLHDKQLLLDRHSLQCLLLLLLNRHSPQCLLLQRLLLSQHHQTPPVVLALLCQLLLATVGLRCMLCTQLLHFSLHTVKRPGVVDFCCANNAPTRLPIRGKYGQQATLVLAHCSCVIVLQ